MSTLDDRLLPVFANQHWLVSLDDVLAAGGSAATASLRVASGRWELVDVSVFRLVGVPTTWQARLLAPILSIGPPAVASHFAAAALHGIDGIGRGVPEISIPRGRQQRRTHVRVHTSTDLDRMTPCTIDGIPATSFDRTILDIGRRVSDKTLLSAIEWGRRNERATWGSLVDTLARHARRGRPGIRRLRRVILANVDRTEVTDSEFELLVLALLAEFGLPTPVLHHKVFVDGRFVAEVDLAYPRLRIAIELDGRVHLEDAVREADLPRQNDLVLEGWTVLRFTWRRFREHPERVVEEILAAIRRTSSPAGV